MPDRRHLLVQAKQSGEARAAVLEGREHVVFPAVLVREQVLRNNLGATFLPAEEIEASANAWNGIDVTIRHPTKNGEPISARDPEVLNAAGVGRLFSAKAENGSLKAEVWIDLARTDDVEDAAEVLNVVDSGEPAELSTGFGAFIENESGTHDGEDYEVVLRGIQPDHLALLVEEQGACSVDDGCGLGVNAEKGDQAETIAARVWAHLRRLVTDQGEFSLDDLREAVQEAIEAEAGGEGRFTYIEELFEDSVVYVVDIEGEGRTFFRAPYTVDEEAREVTLGERTEVEKLTEFVPTENGRIEARHEYLAANPTPQEGDMNREELLNALCKCDEVAFRRETLEAMNDEELAHVASEAEIEAGEAEAEEEEKVEGGEEAVEPTPEPADNADAPAWAKPLMALPDTVTSLSERMDALEEQTEPARNQTAEERKRLVSDIAANSDFEAEELEDRSLGELRKLHKATNQKPATFVGLGGPRKSDPSPNGAVDLGFEPRSTLQTINEEN